MGFKHLIFSKPMNLLHRLSFLQWLPLAAFIGLVCPNFLYSQTKTNADAIEKRAEKIRSELDAHLDAFEIGQYGVSALEAYCSAWQPEELYRRFPLLKAELKICLGRAALARKKWVLSQNLLLAAKTIAHKAHPDLSKSQVLQVEADYWVADAHRQKLLGIMSECPSRLGLTVLHQHQSKRVLEHLKIAEANYFNIVKTNVTPWSQIAAGRIATMHQDFLEAYYLLSVPTYRGAELPSPFEITKRGHFRLGIELNPQYPLILNELDRLLAQFKNTPEIKTYISMANLEERQRQLKSFTQTTRVTVRNPFIRARDLEEGTIAWRNDKMMHKTVTGTWRPIENEEKAHLLNLVLKEGPSPKPEFLLAWIAQTADGTPVNEDWIKWALAHDSLRVRFVGLYILELKPAPKYLPMLLEHWQANQPLDYNFNQLFSTLENALFGLPERNLLAIRSLVRQYRQTAIKLFHSNKTLPSTERAWILAELRDTNLVYRYYDMAEQGRNPAETAIGLYASYLTTPKKALWLLNKNANNPSGLIRCVSQNLLSLDKEVKNTP